MNPPAYTNQSPPSPSSVQNDKYGMHQIPNHNFPGNAAPQGQPPMGYPPQQGQPPMMGYAPQPGQPPMMGQKGQQTLMGYPPQQGNPSMGYHPHMAAPPMQYPQFPGMMMMPVSPAELADRTESSLATCPKCNLTGMTIIGVKPNICLLILFAICMVSMFLIPIGLILIFFMYYRVHICSRCKNELARKKLCC